MRYFASLIFALLSTQVVAQDRAALIATIVSGATNETAEERHTAEIDDCVMTTYRWKNTKDKGWVLWTSFVFGMADASFSGWKKNSDNLFLDSYARTENGRIQLAIISFQMREGVLAQHEKSVMRNRPSGTEPSPRGDGTTHFYDTQDDFFIVHKGPGVHQKAQSFTRGYKTYVERYCTFVG
jgi:hypothetical protein